MFVFVMSLLLSFLTALIIYLVGGLLSSKGKKTENKSIAYASGEKLPSVKIRVNVESIFAYVVGFMIFDILVFVFASFMVASSLLQVIYLCIIFVTNAIFVWMVRTQVGEPV